jgi:hypothetical protein
VCASCVASGSLRYGVFNKFRHAVPDDIPPPYFPPRKIHGPAVSMRSILGGTSGRFPVAITAARLFPISDRAFIAEVRCEDVIQDSSFEVKPFPADRLRYLNDHELLYTTSANSDGLGTAGMLTQCDRPVQGLILLDADNKLSEIQLRLPCVFVAA